MAADPAAHGTPKQEPVLSSNALWGLSGFTALGILIGAFVAGLSGQDNLGPVNVVGAVAAPVLTVVWGAILAYHGRWRGIVASAPVAGLLITIGLYAGAAAVDDLGDSAYPLLTWLIYTLGAALVLLSGTVCGVVARLIVRRMAAGSDPPV